MKTNVDSQDVVNAYRFLLGREPTTAESQAWMHIQTTKDLRRIFLASDEFRASLQKILAAPLPKRLPRDMPALHVDWRANSQEEKLLLAHVARTWTELGKDRPHWSVLSADRFLPEHMDDKTAAMFYASGAADASLVKAILARHGFQPGDVPKVLEYGCGVGRVSPFLAGMFESVTAVDISETHLEMAQRNTPQKNAGFELARAPEFGMKEPFDLWFSFIVLQHNPPPIIAMVLRRAFAMLAPGGVALFQVPTYALGYEYRLEDYLATKTGNMDIEVHCLPQSAIFQIAQEAGCIPLEILEDDLMGPPTAWLSNTFVFRKLPAPNLSVRLHSLLRKF